MATADALDARWHVKGSLLDLRPITDHSGFPDDVIVHVTPRFVKRPPLSSDEQTITSGNQMLQQQHCNNPFIYVSITCTTTFSFSFLLKYVLEDVRTKRCL